MDICFAEETKVVNVLAPVDMSSSALTAEWIAAKTGKRLTWFVSLGVLNASADSMVVTLNVANDAAGTKSATAAASMDVELLYYYKSGVLPSDTFTKTTVASSTWTISSADDGRILMVEVESSKLGQFSSTSVTYDADYVRLAIADPTASALIPCMCIVTGLRYKEDLPPTAIT